MPMFPTDEWMEAYIGKVNASEEYREAAADWEGDIAFLIAAEPDKNFPRDAWLLMDLWHGECRDGGVIDADRGHSARYLISAPYSRWKDVLAGELDPIKGMIQGKLKLKGDLPVIVRYVRAANELVRLTGEVDTIFPDEV